MKISEVLKSLEDGKIVRKICGLYGNKRCHKLFKVNEDSTVLATWWHDKPEDISFDLSYMVIDLEGKYETA